MKKEFKKSDCIIALVFVLIIAFVLKMIQLYETTGGIPDTLVTCVLGGGVFELLFTAWIKVQKLKNGKDVVEDESDY